MVLNLLEFYVEVTHSLHRSWLPPDVVSHMFQIIFIAYIAVGDICVVEALLYREVFPIQYLLTQF